MVASTQALVIGNGAYSASLKLTSPVHDAKAVAAILRDLQIEVTLGLDLDFDATGPVVDAFIERVVTPTTTKSVLYYSGHALQNEDANYIVPVDFDRFGAENLAKLISVQAIIDRMSSASAVRIVILDACRSNADARSFVTAKDIVVDGTPKAFFVDGASLPRPGLAEMRAAHDTFIAFAASPGDIAYDGIAGSTLSPFTKALVKHLDAVDLPIANLTSRIRTDVLAQTGGRQRTWDQSSLMTPFYFNPGSLLMFTGNLMSLIGLCITTLTYTLVLLSSKDAPSGDVSAGAVILALAFPAACFLIFLIGTQSVYARLRGTSRDAPGTRTLLPLVVSNSLVKGVAGGLLGSVFSAVFLAVPYYGLWADPTESFGLCLLEVTVGTAFAACPLGFLALVSAQIGTKVRLFATSNTPWLGTLVGSSIGGLVAGAVSAPGLTAYFGLMTDRPEMTPTRLLPGSIVGAALLVFTIISFDFERLSKRRLCCTAIASISSLLIGALATGAVFGPLQIFGVVVAVTTWLESSWQDPVKLAEGGFIYGLPVGLILGFVIGSAMVITQRLSRKAVLD